MHDHRQFARHRDGRLAVTEALGQCLAPALLTLSLRLKRVSSAEAASYSARRTSGSPTLLIRPCTSIKEHDAGLLHAIDATNSLPESR